MQKIVLIVEDSVTTQAVLSAVVSKLGYTPVVCNDGFDAMQYLNQKPAHAVLLDIYMSGVDGISMMGHISNKFPGLPVVIVSGSSDPEDRAAVMRLGAKEYIAKAMPLADMQGSLEKALRALL